MTCCHSKSHEKPSTFADVKNSQKRNNYNNNNIIIDDMENINSTNKGRGLLLPNKPLIVFWGKERISQRIQRYSRVTLYRSTHPKQEQDQTKGSSYGLDWLKKGIWYGSAKVDNKLPQNVQISHEVINFIEKTMKTWRVELKAGRSLAEAKIQRYISRRCTIIVTIHNCYDATLPYSQKIHRKIQT